MAQGIDPCPWPTGSTLASTFPNFTAPEPNTISFETLTSSLTFSGWSNTNVIINQKLIVDNQFTIRNCNVQFGVNGSILVVGSGSLDFSSSRIFGYGWIGWAGITVQGTISFVANHIEDALTALSIRSQMPQTISFNYFNRNNIGVDIFSVTANALIAANTFDCTSNLPAGMTTPPRSTAGISVRKSIAAIGVDQGTLPHVLNRFNNLKDGIYAYASTLNMNYANFTCNTEHGINGKGGTMNVSGGGSAFRNLFDQNERDVWVSSVDLNLSESNFTNCRTDNIRSMDNVSSEKIRVYLNQITISGQTPGAKTGIYLDRPNGGQNSVIDWNFITIDPFTENRAGIHAIGKSATTGRLTINNNQILALPGGTPPNAPGLHAFVNIGINDAPNYWLYRNVILTPNDDSYEHRNRWGFFLHDWAAPSNGNVFEQNQVIGGSNNIDFGCCAYHFSQSGPWHICENLSDKTLRGFHVNFNCAPSLFGENIIGAHGGSAFPATGRTAGLLIDDGALLGPQFCRHNIWTSTYISPDEGAWHKVGDPLSNEIKYDPSQGLEVPNRIDPVTGWFIPHPCPPPTVHCDAGMAAEEYEEHLSDRERQTAEDNQAYLPDEAPEGWDDKYQLMRKLLQFPGLLDSGAFVEQFFEAHYDESPGLFARFDFNLHNTMMLDSAAQAALGASLSEIELVFHELDSLDRAYCTDSLALAQPSTAYFSQRAVWLQQLADASADRDEVRDSLDENRIDGFEQCATFLSSLPESQVFEQNQKVLSSIKLKKAQRQALDTTDIEALRGIAQQCEIEAGQTKYRAKSMLPISESAAAISDHGPMLEDCDAPRTSGMGNRQYRATAMWLSPNPAKQTVTLASSQPFSGEIRLIDLAGQTVRLHQIAIETTQFGLSLSGVAPGMYFLQVKNEAIGTQVLRLLTTH